MNASPSPAIRAELDIVARACRILEMEGHGDLAQGHLSWRDPGGKSFWMKRNDIGLGEMLGPDDFVELDFNGAKLYGSGRPHSEWPIHSEIFLARPDVTVVAHTHPPHACLMTGSTDLPKPYTLEADKLKPIGRFSASAALINDKELGRDLAVALGQGDVVFLANHGVAFCGATVAETVCTGVFLERACRVAVLAAAAPMAWVIPNAADRELRHRQMMTPGHIEQTWAYFNRKLDALHTDAEGKPKAIYGDR